MPDATPGGTVALPENPELQNLRDRETALKAELERLEKMDLNKVSADFDVAAVKRRAQIHLAEIRKAIEEIK